MQHKSITFNGIKKPWLYLLEGRSKSPFAPIRNNLLHVPGMPGAHISSSETEVLYITQPIGFIVENDEHVLQITDELAKWLVTDKSVELQFDDEPGRTYFAKLEGTIEDFQKFVYQRKGMITFLCADPYKYGPELTSEIPSDVFNLTNQGTAKANPIFELEVLAPITYAMIQNQNYEYMMIGRPINVDDVPYSRLETILIDNCSSLVGWTALPNGSQLDSGIVGGVMEVQNGHSFSAANYGTNPNGWVGPAIKRSLSEPLQDFFVEIRIGTFNTHGEVGSLELHLLDETNNVVAILAMRDSIAGGVSENRAFIQLGQAGNRHQYVNYNGGYQTTWNDFSGIIRLEREGTEFRAHVAVIEEDGRHNRRYTPPVFNDSLGAYQGKIAQVLVYDAKAKEYSTYDKLMNNIHISKINQQVGVPYIADVGDIITFDHIEKMIYINGEPRPDLKDFGGSFFHLAKGENQLIVHPSNAFNTTARYRERFR